MTESNWIWLDARYTPAQAARLCRTVPASVHYALSEGRLAVGADGLIGGLALYRWYVRRTSHGEI